LEREKLLKVDFHSHTIYSKDSLTSITDLIKAARRRGLDRMVVTDHNCLQGSLLAHAAAPDLVIAGEEVQTLEGEFLAAYVTEEVPRGLDPLEALRRLREQGAFVSISHPFDPRRSGWSLDRLEQLAPLLDAIEVGNARVLNAEDNAKALAFSRRMGLAGNAGSDGHHPSEIGRMYTLLPEFQDAESLREAVKSASVQGRISHPAVHLFSVWARFVKAWKSTSS